MNRKSVTERAEIIQLLVEGNSMRSTSRIANCSINTVSKLLVDVGARCSEYQNETLVNLPCKRIQVDEIWSYVHTKRKNVKDKHDDSIGDVWTYTAICPDTKLVPSWYVGSRSMDSTYAFIDDVAARMANRIQLTSDGYSHYKDAVDVSFMGVDYGILNKMYDKNDRYIGARKIIYSGDPDKSKMTTAHVERQNLTMRMNIRRFARKTNAFSKKVENHCHAVSLHFMYYNFCRIHKSLRVTPAMEAGVTNRLWSLEDIASI